MSFLHCAAALSACLAVAVFPTVPAAAEPAGTGAAVIVLGDSYSANSAEIAYEPSPCAHGATSWPTQVGRRLGIADTADLLDLSCSGGAVDTPPGWTLLHQARKAAAANAFGPATRVITLQAGMNDAWGANSVTMIHAFTECLLNLVSGCGLDAPAQNRLPDYLGVTAENLAQRVRAIVEYAKYYAPAARIVLVGYPEIWPSGGTSACIDVAGLGRVTQPRAEGVIAYFDALDRAQRGAAELLGIDFLDTRGLTAGHGLCSAEPLVNGVLDPRTDLTGIPAHPSGRGDALVAEALIRRAGL
ncbi:SGNH/GDSL hydrolase family protein [Nocardia thailandica]